MSIFKIVLNISIRTNQLVANFCKLCSFYHTFIISFNVGFLIFKCIILEKNEGVTNITISRNKTRFLDLCISKTIQMNLSFLVGSLISKFSNYSFKVNRSMRFNQHVTIVQCYKLSLKWLTKTRITCTFCPYKLEQSCIVKVGTSQGLGTLVPLKFLFT